MHKSSTRNICTDVRFYKNENNGSYINVLFIRLVALDIEFRNVDFSYCIFDTAYLRNCKFFDCKFIGVKFKDSNFMGSKFPGCDFKYAQFEKTQIDPEIMAYGCPTEENLRVKFARSLRVNFQGLGDAISANKAISLELNSNREHLYNAWKSPIAYYRNKYKGFERVSMFVQWISFKLLDYIWGNGESALKLVRSVFIAIAIFALIDVFKWGHPGQVHDYYYSSIRTFNVAMGSEHPSYYPKLYFSIIFLTRLIYFGLFMSILIKRFNRR